MSDDLAIRRLLQLVSAALAALIAATWRLWTPNHPWPQIPWVAAARHVPPWWDWTALGLIAAAGALQFAPGCRLSRIAASIQCVGLAAALVVDQHRLQPWAYEYLLITAILTLAWNERGVRCVRWLVAGIYLHSALSKLDAAYLESNGRQLWEGLLHSIGFQPHGWDRPGPQWVCLLFPVGELCVGAALLVRRTRRIGLAGSILMHVLLIWTLGPFGLRHEPGVLLWNAAFIVQNIILFRRPPPVESSAAPPADVPQRERMAQGVAAAAIGLPFLEPFGYWDHWPSWAVYSSRPAIVTVLVDDAAVANLPGSLRPYVGPAEALTAWRPASFDQWSLAALGCPIYPQERFRIATVLAVADQTSLGENVLLRVQSSPHRLTGRRAQIEVRGAAAIRRYAENYWINVRAR